VRTAHFVDVATGEVAFSSVQSLVYEQLQLANDASKVAIDEIQATRSNFGMFSASLITD
jgi:hypothetical protein